MKNMNKLNVKNDLALILSRYQSNTEIEKQHRLDMLNFLQASDNPIYSDNVKGHFTASAWVVTHDKKYVLLTHHSKIGKWFQLGGHIEKFDQSFGESCLREASEESGIASLSMAEPSVIDLDIHTIPEYKGVSEHIHYDITCYFVAPKDAKAIKSAESKQLKWVALEQVKFLTDDAAINRMIDKTKNLVSEF